MTKEMPAFQCGQGQDLTGAPAASCLLTALSPLAQDNMQSRLDRVRLSGRVTTVFIYDMRRLLEPILVPSSV